MRFRDFVQQNWDDGRYHMNDVSNASWHLDDPEALEAAHGFAKKLVDKGWYTMHWPTEHGGQDAPFTRMLTYREEMAYRGAPANAAFGGDAIILHGTPWQKDEWFAKDRQRGHANRARPPPSRATDPTWPVLPHAPFVMAMTM